MPAKVKPKQVKLLAEALRQGTPNRNRIALQMVKDVLDESSFDAGPGPTLPGKVGQAASRLVGKVRERAEERHPDER
jgi:pyruvate dehydrogenase (quinone)/pyruvate oxidase